MPKHSKLFQVLIITILFLLIVHNSQQGFAYNSSADSSNNEASHYEEYISSIFVSSAKTPCLERDFLTGVSVSGDGRFLVVFSNGSIDYYIEIYNNSYQLQQCIHVRNAGKVVASFSESDNYIILHLIRDHLAITVTEEGQYISSTEVDTVPESISYLDGTKDFLITINNVIYELSTKNGSKIFSIESEDGEVFYQCTVEPYDPIPSVLLVAIALCLIFTFIILKKHETGESSHKPK